MDFLLDTCVISELSRKNPNEFLVKWLRNAEENKLYLSVITIGEIVRGIENLPSSPKKTQLDDFFQHQVLRRFDGRIYPLDSELMISWGKIYARLARSGKPLSVMDSLIGVTGVYHNAVIVTRNVDDFTPIGVEVINPWNPPSDNLS
jgi:predicted nucleic acid-binding protein